MQVIFQFPIIDVRPVAGGNSISVWPTSDLKKEALDELMRKRPFIRNFGGISSSPEGFFCNINCIKYDELHQQGFPVNTNLRSVISNSYKRLYSDSGYTKRAEIAFKDNLENISGTGPNSASVNITDILKHYADLPLHISDTAVKPEASAEKDPKQEATSLITTKLFQAGPLLAKNYCDSTTRHKDQADQSKYVVSGEICMTVIFQANRGIQLPNNATKIDEYNIDGVLVNLFGYKWNYEGYSVKVWIVELPEPEETLSAQAAAMLQTKTAHLFFLNAEKETTRILVNGLGNYDADSTQASDQADLKNYLKKTPAKIFRKERFETDQAPLRDFVLQSDKVNFATVEDIKGLLDEFTRANLNKLGENMKATPLKKKILFITSNPTESNPFDFGEQLRAIDKALQSGSDRDYFEILTPKTSVERDEIMQLLYTNNPDYLHITLHNSKIDGLYFQDSAKNPNPVPAPEFANYLKLLNKKKKPEAVLICACNSLAHAEAIKDYCQYAMGTNYKFPEPAAVVYANKFYNALFNGNDISFCHEVAIQGIEFSRPPFDDVDNRKVYEMPQLVYSDKKQ